MLFDVVWRLEEARDVLACRRVCRGWREVVHRHPVVGRLLGGRGNVPPDSAGESPMERLCRARETEEKWRKTRRGWRRREVVGDWETDEVEAAVHAGKYVVVVQKRTWGVWEERGNSFAAIGHLREAHRGRFGGQMVVLRDKFVVVGVGGFVHALDCGETMDLPNILQADEEGCARLLADGDSVGVCSRERVKIYTFKVRVEKMMFVLFDHGKEHAPFGWHHEEAGTVELETGERAVRLASRGRGVVVETAAGKETMKSVDGRVDAGDTQTTTVDDTSTSSSSWLRELDDKSVVMWHGSGKAVVREGNKVVVVTPE
jgi:hypothetical protein